ncbi:MAG: hypothetical protein AAGA48_28605 [Myxococcota bacterium]
MSKVRLHIHNAGEAIVTWTEEGFRLEGAPEATAVVAKELDPVHQQTTLAKARDILERGAGTTPREGRALLLALSRLEWRVARVVELCRPLENATGRYSAAPSALANEVIHELTGRREEEDLLGLELLESAGQALQVGNTVRFVNLHLVEHVFARNALAASQTGTIVSIGKDILVQLQSELTVWVPHACVEPTDPS